MKQELIQKDKQSVMPIILIALENVYIQICAWRFPQCNKSVFFITHMTTKEF